MNETATNTLQAGPALGPSLLQAVAALLVVIGLIFLTSYLLRRFAFGGQLARTMKRTAKGPALAITDSLWIDARHRLLTISEADGGTRRYTILLGPQGAIQLSENPTGSAHGSTPQTTA